jgi:hypothetical protein
MTDSIQIEKVNEAIKLKDIDPSLWHQEYNSSFYNEDDDDDSSIEEGEGNSEVEQVMCGCGKALSAGWNCTQCRHNCSTCHRALATEEICSRCDVKRDTSSTELAIII